MNRELFKITIDGIKGRKKISILFVIIFTVSFAFGIITLSITSSMNQTNEQYRMNTYGAWSSAVKFSEDDPVNAYNGKVILPEWAENYGSITICAKLQTDSGDEYIGTMDEAVKDVGKIEMVDGRMPQGNDEVAMEADVLSELGYDYTLGQKISFNVSGEVEPSETEEPVKAECTYTLVGVIKEYTKLWNISDDNGYEPLPSAVVSDDGGMKLMDSLKAGLDERLKESPGQMIELKLFDKIWFLSGGDLYDYEKIAAKQKDYEASLKTLEADGYVDEYWMNDAAFKNKDMLEYNYIYTAVIFVVMLFAIICMYSIYMHRQIRQTALFRSIGITKRQLGVMTFYENIVLGIPSLICGAALGAAGTWLILRFALAENIADVKLYIPHKQLLVMALLWTVGIMIARMAINIAALRQPLTGKMYPVGKRAKGIMILKKAMILQLSVLLCFVMIFGIFESLYPYSQMEHWNNLPSYKIYSGNLTGTDDIEQIENMDSNFEKQLTAIPGIRSTDKMGILEAYLTFEDMWDDGLAVDILAGQDSADDGIQISLCVVPDDKIDGADVIMTFPTDMDGNITYNDKKYGKLDEYTDLLGSKTDIGIKLKGQKILTDKLSNAHEALKEQRLNIGKIIDIKQTDRLLASGSGEFYEPYTILCSQKYLKNLLSKVEPGYMCRTYRTGGQDEEKNDSGYNFMDVYTKLDAGYLATDYAVAGQCRRNGLQMINNRESYYANAQQYIQNLIMLLCSSLCIVIVLILITINIITLQMENEKRKYEILKSIGMSNRQIKRKISAEAFLGAVISSVFGWGIYLFYLGIKSAGTLERFSDRFVSNLYGLRSYGLNAVTAGIVTAAGILTVFMVSFVIRGKQWQKS